MVSFFTLSLSTVSATEMIIQSKFVTFSNIDLFTIDRFPWPQPTGKSRRVSGRERESERERERQSQTRRITNDSVRKGKKSYPKVRQVSEEAARERERERERERTKGMNRRRGLLCLLRKGNKIVTCRMPGKDNRNRIIATDRSPLFGHLVSGHWSWKHW